MSKKLTWEVEKTSLVLRIADGDRETTWKLTKNTTHARLARIFSEMSFIMDGIATGRYGATADFKPMLEGGRTVDAEELAELQRYQHNETSEEASRAAQAAAVRQLNIGAKWFEADDDETYSIPIPDYDTGEVRPR